MQFSILSKSRFLFFAFFFCSFERHMIKKRKKLENMEKRYQTMEFVYNEPFLAKDSIYRFL